MFDVRHRNAPCSIQELFPNISEIRSCDTLSSASKNFYKQKSWFDYITSTELKQKFGWEALHCSVLNDQSSSVCSTILFGDGTICNITKYLLIQKFEVNGWLERMNLSWNSWPAASRICYRITSLEYFRTISISPWLPSVKVRFLG